MTAPTGLSLTLPTVVVDFNTGLIVMAATRGLTVLLVAVAVNEVMMTRTPVSQETGVPWARK